MLQQSLVYVMLRPFTINKILEMGNFTVSLELYTIFIIYESFPLLSVSPNQGIPFFSW